ncbi:tRNA1(Val) (adenine(37)-N6)-methyltransferase [Sedimentibacter sp. zth1]|uniref:tRNA1(Val) (adenine(37)-N6)-methyltransferase n=1 Tax=Sedimentibacter sp. zth1 TaxID=2816908 RepID=UPI001F5F0267|nr:tRNA1(Val) (adenine(37)-N6)-methyltransferase [Sedimentibacter sp. zth1]
MAKIILKENEKIEDLQCKGLKIIQNKKWFCFGMDAVLLANFCDKKRGAKTVDLGTGTGIIPLILYAKKHVDKVYGVEIQTEVAEMAKRSIEINGLQDKIEILNIDLKEVTKYLEPNSFDIVTSNPPYKLGNSGIVNPTDQKAISRHEILCTLEDVIKNASKLLKQYGKFYLVHRPDRLVDIMCLLRQYKLEPKRIRFIHPHINDKPNMVIIQASKNANRELKFDAPLYVYNENGNFSKEVHTIYDSEE